jgi:hypothetical protein
MTLEIGDGDKSERVEMSEAAGEDTGRRFVRLVERRKAIRARLMVQSAPVSVNAVWLDDVRVSGQSDTLRRYVRTTLHVQ